MQAERQFWANKKAMAFSGIPKSSGRREALEYVESMKQNILDSISSVEDLEFDNGGVANESKKSHKKKGKSSKKHHHNSRRHSHHKKQTSINDKYSKM